MNLKSPHLVTIFDIKRNPSGRNFVVMEYVAGPSLQELLADAPDGLGSQKAAFFLREIAKGLNFLHERGIVHRDLKPGNIFYEAGYVKIGDYGLSKLISPDHHSGQTITVGTVHYMAPEIGAGRYDRSIDIYALGVLLYEMLTGNVPYSGDSYGEVLMKHMMAEPDMSGIDQPMSEIIRKALAKDPGERYQTTQEMVEAVFGRDEIRNSVSHFSPDSLTLVAGRVAGKMQPPPPGPPPVPPGPPPPKPPVAANVAPTPATMTGDSVTARQRYVLAALAATVVAGGTGLLARSGVGQATVVALLAICGTSAGLLLARDRLKLHLETGAFRRLAFGLVACVACILACSLVLVASPRWYRQTVVSALVSMLLVDWYAQMSPDRKERLSLKPAFLAGLCAFVCAAVLGGSEKLAVGILAGVSLVVQVASPFRGSAPAQAPPVPAPPPPTGPPPASGVSDRSRLAALLLAVLGPLMGTAGLHRFYAGKVGTGLLWLFTGGLLMVGQIYDVVMIALGRFGDSRGLPLLAWDSKSKQASITARPMSSSGFPSGASLVSGVLSTIGGLLLLAAFSVGLVIALHVPEMIAAGVMGSELAEELEREIGMADWPRLARQLAVAATAVLATLAVIFLIVARRKAGFIHMLRSVVGSGGMFLTLPILDDAFRRFPWREVADALSARRIGPGIDLVVNRANGWMALFGLAVLLGSIMMLAWRPRERALPAAAPRQGGTDK